MTLEKIPGRRVIVWNARKINNANPIDLSKYARIPPSSAGGMNGLPSPLGGEG